MNVPIDNTLSVPVEVFNDPQKLSEYIANYLEGNNIDNIRLRETLKLMGKE